MGAVVNPGWAFNGFSGGINSAVAPQVLTVNAPVTLTANFTPEFSLAIPAPVTTLVNGSVQLTITVTGQNGFNDTVTFDAPTLPTGATATFNPPTASAGGTSTVTITAPPVGGTFAFTLRATASSGLSHGVAGSLAVQDFTVTPLTPTLSAGLSDTAQYVFAIGSVAGFNGTVSVVPASIRFTANPTPSGYDKSCSISGLTQQAVAGTFTLTFTISSFRCDAWTYDIPLQFTASGINHAATVQLFGVTTGIFNLSSPSAPQSIAPGAVATFPVHATSNFSGQTVTFPYPPVVPCGTPGASPASVTAPGDTSFTVNTAGCAAGSYTVIVTGRSSHGQTVEQGLAIPFFVGTAAPPDFSITPTPSVRSVVPGASELYTLNVAPINGFSQPVSLAVSGLPAGVTASFPVGSTVNGSGSLTLRVATSALAVSGNIAITATGGGLTRSATLTLNVVAPQSQSGFTLGTIPTTTVPADGTVIAVPVPVTALNGSSATVTLRSVSHLPPGINVGVSGHTLMISAASTVPSGTYLVEYEGDDGNGGICRGGGGFGVGGGGTNFTMYLQVPSDNGVPNNNQATRIGPYYAYSVDGTPAQQQRYPAGMVQSCSAGPGISVAVSWPSQSAPSDAYLFDLVYTVGGTAALGDRAVSCQVAAYRATPALGRPGVSVYQTPTPQMSGPNQISLHNDGQTVVSGPYYVYSVFNGATYYDSVSGVTCQTSGGGMSTVLSSPSNSDSDPSSFDLAFTANSSGTAQTGARTLSCTWGGAAVTPDNGPVTVTLYDGNPVISALQQFPPDSSDGSFPVLITGRNFGSTGQLMTCLPTASVCNGTPALTVVGISTWNDQSISVRLKPSTTAEARAYLVQVTSGGLLGNGFFGDPQQQGGGKSNTAVVTIGTPVITLSLTRQDLSHVRAVATPSGGTFAASVSPRGGADSRLVLPAPTVSPDSQGATITLLPPANYDIQGRPVQGALVQVSIAYTLPDGTSTIKQFNVAYFGMSCYIRALESDWGDTQNCKNDPFHEGPLNLAVVYQGVVTNPVSVSWAATQALGIGTQVFTTSPTSPVQGTFCASFLREVKLQGTGQLSNGGFIHWSNGFQPGLQNTADGPAVIPGKTLARDKSIIPGRGVLVDLAWPGNPLTGMHADDTGGAIIGNRLDLYGGNGKAACNSYSGNPIVIGACNVNSTYCPGSTIQ